MECMVGYKCDQKTVQKKIVIRHMKRILWHVCEYKISHRHSGKITQKDKSTFTKGVNSQGVANKS